MAKGPMLEKSFAFAIDIVNLYKYLCREKSEFVMSKQLLRSGTAVGAMIREAQNAESKADFIHKLAVAQKECAESIYWLELLFATSFIDENQILKVSNDANSILRLLRSAIITTKQESNKF